MPVPPDTFSASRRRGAEEPQRRFTGVPLPARLLGPGDAGQRSCSSTGAALQAASRTDPEKKESPARPAPLHLYQSVQLWL